MDILKKTLLACLLLCGFFATAQDYQKNMKAFEASYAAEGKGEYTAAIDAIKAIYAENSYEINIRLGWLHYVSGRFADALPYYQKSIELMPLSVEARLGYVNPAAALGNWAQVEKQYNEILTIDPHNSTVNYRMGLLHYGRGAYQTALNYFSKVINLYPFDYDTAIMVGWSQLKLGRMREAKVMFQKALLMKPNDSSALEGLGLIQ